MTEQDGKLAEQDTKLATQADFVLDLAGKIDGLNSWVQDAQGLFEKHEGQVGQVGSWLQERDCWGIDYCCWTRGPELVRCRQGAL